jgi:hypothetical protein
MSTWLYLQCLDHDPVITSDGESGQHLTDLPEIRADIAMRAAYAAMSPDMLYGDDFGWSVLHHFRRNTIRFLRSHPRCRICIRSEYGIEYPIAVHS